MKYSLIIFILIGISIPVITKEYLYEDKWFWGLWQTEMNISPKITLTIKPRKRVSVEINNKIINVDYYFASTLGNKGIIEFQWSSKDEIVDHTLYCIRGYIKQKQVLTCFYKIEEGDGEGVILNTKWNYTVLYNIKKYGFSD